MVAIATTFLLSTEGRHGYTRSLPMYRCLTSALAEATGLEPVRVLPLPVFKTGLIAFPVKLPFFQTISFLGFEPKFEVSETSVLPVRRK